METAQDVELVGTDKGESQLPLLIVLFNFWNAHCLSLKGSNSREAETVSPPHSVVLGIHAVTKLRPPMQEECARKASATSLNFGAMAGRDSHSSLGFTVIQGFKERRAFTLVLKLKLRKRNKRAKVWCMQGACD